MTSSRLRLTLAGLALLSSSLWLPVGDFKINRIMRPIPVPLSQLIGTFGVILVLFIGGVMLWTLSRQSSQRIKTLILWVLSVMVGCLLWGMSNTVPPGVEYNPEAARMALGAGFYGLLLAVLLAISTQPNGRWPLVMSLVFPLVLSAANQIPMIGIVKEYQNYQSTFNAEFVRHLTLAFSSGLIAIVPGILLGIGPIVIPAHRKAS
jgi:hypothetical protein